MDVAASKDSLGSLSTAVEARRRQLRGSGFGERLQRRDATLWGADNAAVAANRLGWITAPADLRAGVPEIAAFAREVMSEGFTHAVLLGMGGSSLAPEVFRRILDVRPGMLDLRILDSTSPAAVREIARTADPRHTLFIVSSKSGGTIEVTSFERHFFDWVHASRGAEAGRSFVAITDPGTPLEHLATERGYRSCFLNPPDIGGRYSALSRFGLVPASLIGADLERLLDGAIAESRRTESGADEPPTGVELGAALGELARLGHDKLNLALDPDLEPLGAWIEQLVAESTGKDGRGILPVVGETLGVPTGYGADRMFAGVSIGAPAAATARALDALAAAGHPVLRWRLSDAHAIGAEMYRWEVATAAMAQVLGVNPFDELNVTEAKVATQAALDRGRRDGGGGLTPGAAVAALFEHVRSGDYFALLAYLHATPALERRLAQIREAVRRSTRLATTLGYGPRFLHSTGQLHKGGPDTGIFLQLTADEGDEPIPGAQFGFAELIGAQAGGDFEVLSRRGRRVQRVELGSAPEQVLDQILESVEALEI